MFAPGRSMTTLQHSASGVPAISPEKARPATIAQHSVAITDAGSCLLASGRVQ